MDAKPQRPLARAIRVHDENMPPPTNGPIGKTLHQRTKSTSALGGVALNQKKVLGETNANLRVIPKDDSEIGKASPGKIKIHAEPAAPAQTFQRQAVRPLATKSSSMQIAGAVAATRQAAAAAPEVQQPKKVVPKKSKVLRDPVPAAVQLEAPAKVNNVPVQPSDIVNITAHPQPALATEQSTNNFILQRDEVRRTESVPLRDEAGPKLPVQPVGAVSSIPAVVSAAPQEHAHQQPIDVLPAHNGPAFQVATPPEEFIEEDFDDQDQDYMTAQSFDMRDATETTIFNPAQTKKNKQEIAEAREWVEANRTPDDIEDEQWDTSMVAEYGEEIFDYMREMESRMAPNPYYMDQQTEIQWSMRGVLMDWVVQVHQRFNLLPETLFLTVNYIDRFLSCKIVSLGKLQLVGATAIFVAAKYEEVNCPTINEIIYMVDNGYTAEELLKAERFMLSMLQFELGWPGPMSFLRRISKADDYDLETRTLAKYFLEVTIMDERFVGCKPSFLAAGAHCMARLMLRKGDWTKAHVFYSDYTFRQLHRLLGAIYECCSNPQKHHAAVFEKYSDKRYKRASTFVGGEVMRGFQLPFSYRSSMGVQNTTGTWIPQ
ncbi:G2/mitotic-specific cyclin-4 [Fulvia fulva]|uniref:G2/mitotic-specific cyclin-4 n=1 Tax=Passalora fulva TaxID=5499 RepID=A0A9Q8LAH7_PASFU|nr:G2/mitotic-specific cyclin-4 [Fulvia fulva]KAK4631471.1 G2/mitotic-specific cyclin-4 [Fulvia fulva]KAK4633120.1 G2/mitotic-specific cyclin-4 [Fulvia fulva]UJO13911.1 G2/mitotic-specific cyclin-4 [Fulvia fulva]WPV10557.1 G2/mitotic-specific cyclin-4 [Fulvia fulva]WPV26096.1 G2/mitotic-specific cyclin-4 [Fulvia fulva]